MAKPDKLPRWASVDSDDTVTGQANKVEPTETKKNTGWAFLEKPPFNIFNWLFNLIYQWLSWVDDNVTSSATYIIATDTSEKKEMADRVITSTDDAGLIISVIAASISASGGGKIILMEGTYYIGSQLELSDNITLEGMGASTILKRNANITSVILVDNKVGVIIKDLAIDGNKSVYNTGTKYGILGATSGYATEGYNKCINCFVYDNYGSGIALFNYIVNCSSYSNTTAGFSSNYYLSNCESYGNAQGYNGCSYLSNCVSRDNSGIGFTTCSKLNSCLSEFNGSDGYNNCTVLTTCNSYSNTGYGYNSCKTMGFNKSSTNTAGAYNASYADSGTSNAVADTASGGYNS